MVVRITSLLSALFCLFFSVLCQAQNEIHCDVKIKTSAIDNSELGVVKYVTKGDFMFRKMENWRILDFTRQDAQLIVDYFLDKNEVLACQSQYIDKTVKVFVERKENMPEFPFKECITELQEMGYFITRFRKSEEIVVFPMQNCAAALTIHDFEEDMAIYTECPPCGQVVVKDKQIMEEEGSVLKANNFSIPEDVEIDSTEFDQTIVEEKEAMYKKPKALIKTEETLGEIIDHSKVIEGVIDTSLTEKSIKIDDEEKSINEPMIRDKAIILDEEMKIEQVKEVEQKPIDESMLDEEMEAQQENVDEQMPVEKQMFTEEVKEDEPQNSADNDKSIQNKLTEPEKMIGEEKERQILNQDQLPTFEKDADKMKKEKEKDVPKKDKSKK